jgi:hypothetical protein
MVGLNTKTSPGKGMAKAKKKAAKKRPDKYEEKLRINGLFIEQNGHVMIDYTPENALSLISHIKLLNENMMIWHTPAPYREPVIEIFKRIL